MQELRQEEAAAKELIEQTVSFEEVDFQDLDFEEIDSPENLSYLEEESAASSSGIRFHKLSIKTGRDLFLSRYFIKHESIVSAAKRNKISASALLDIATAFIKAGNGDVNSVCLSYSFVYTSLKTETENLSMKIQSNWRPPKKALLHWDDKIMETLDGSSNEKRLPVLISGCEESKLLGVPTIGKNLKGIYGKTVADAVSKLIHKWKCQNEVIGVVFDTTSSNTGVNKGACS